MIPSVIPPPNPSIGDMWIDASTNECNIYTGNAGWIAMLAEDEDTPLWEWSESIQGVLVILDPDWWVVNKYDVLGWLRENNEPQEDLLWDNDVVTIKHAVNRTAFGIKWSNHDI